MSADLKTRTPAVSLEEAAQDLAAKLPALLVEARRVASTVAQGTHGRRRAGPGETFWQYRSFEHGDSASLIDWRRSAGSSHLFVREREWEAAHTVWIWIDLSPSMHFRSHLATSTKAERAIVLALALASLLSDAGERVGIPGLMQAKAGHNTASFIIEALARSLSGPSRKSLPDANCRLGRHSELAIFSDFLEPPEGLAAAFSAIARQGVRGHIVQVLDPAEESLPYQGRVEFFDEETEVRFIAERAESLRDSYRQKLSAHKAAIAFHAGGLGWTPFLHHTNRPAVEALLPLHMHLSGLEKAYRAKGTLKGQLAGDQLAGEGDPS
ncbi:MAG: DUF58 domain-containing protein [Rhodomicrobium sp.]